MVGKQRFFPVDAGITFDCVRSDLLKIDWGVNHFVADFVLPDDDDHVLRVSFDRPTIVRILDEMPLSTEKDPTQIEGLIANHFAYRVEGAKFAETQSEAWKEVVGPVQQYEFVTGWGCVDVISAAVPSFHVVSITRSPTS